MGVRSLPLEDAGSVSEKIDTVEVTKYTEGSKGFTDS
jgi:hypothetical protein